MDLTDTGERETLRSRARDDHHLDVLPIAVAFFVITLLMDATIFGGFGSRDEGVAQPFALLGFLRIEAFVTIALEDQFKGLRTRIRSEIAVKEDFACGGTVLRIRLHILEDLVHLGTHLG